jgi:hypothetical protein
MPPLRGWNRSSEMLVPPRQFHQITTRIVLALGILVFLVLWAKNAKFSQDWFVLTIEKPGVMGTFHLFYDLGEGFCEQNSAKVNVTPREGDCQIYFPLPDRSIRGLRIDSKIIEKTYRIKSMRFNKFEWKAGDIIRSFKPVNDISQFKIEGGRVTICVTGSDPRFIFSNDFSNIYAEFAKKISEIRLLLYLLCVVVSTIAFFLTRHVFRFMDRCLKLAMGNSIDPVRRNTRIIFIILGILFMVKLWLVSSQSLSALGSASYDDRLFLNIAGNLLRGRWLGPYNEMALAKGLFYPLWIAFAFLMNVPLLLSEHLLYGVACWIMLVSLRPLRMAPTAQVIFFTVLLFNPVTYNNAALRVLREGIYPSLTLLVVACAVGLALRFNQGLKAWNRWSVSLGISLSAFWLTREEGVWIFPLLAVVFCAGILSTRREWKRKVAVCLVPIALLISSNVAVSTINYFKYGWFTTVEFNAKEFLDAYGALNRVKHAHWAPQDPLPTETRLKIYPHSRSFSELKPYLEGPLGEGWSKHSGAHEMRGWFMWAFRDAAAHAGHYSDGREALRYYRKVADEINAACDDGRLDCYSKRSSMAPPWRWEYFSPILEAAWRSLKYMCHFEEIDVFPLMSSGDEQSLDLFRDLTHERLSEEGRHFAGGWIFHETKDVDLDLFCPTEPLALNALAAYQDSPEVYEYFLRNGRQFSYAKKARFLAAATRGDTVLRVKEGSRILAQFPLSAGSDASLGANGLFFLLDKGFTDWDSLVRQRTIDQFRLQILNFIHIIYRYAFQWFFIAGLPVFFAAWILDAFRKRELWGYVAGCALLLGVVCRILVVSAVSVMSFDCLNSLYLSSAYPLLLGFTFLAWERFLNPDYS